MNNELEMMWKEAVVDHFTHPGVCVDGLMRSTKIFSTDSRSSGRYFNPEPVEYQVEF